MTTQIAVKLPDDLIHRVDELVGTGEFPSRSAAVRYGLEAVVRSRARLAVDQRYRQAFDMLPESEEELAHATRLAVRSIEDEPWERWW
ncbi:MAG: ribbon-helix-helix domain-containing protein [Acidimicrobiales bacterium]